MNLAVATLGLSLVLESLILNNSERTGGITGTQIGEVDLFGIDFDTTRHADRYALLAFGCFVVLALGVANLRRGRAGRRLVAVRTNERAAAALGISVIGAKLYAFGLARRDRRGGRRADRVPPADASSSTRRSRSSSRSWSCSTRSSAASGSWSARCSVPRSPRGRSCRTLFGDILDNDQVVQLALGVVVVVVLLWLPNGLASIDVRRLQSFGRRKVAELSTQERPVIAPHTLAAEGGARALRRRRRARTTCRSRSGRARCSG